jgi:hypothetical protein
MSVKSSTERMLYVVLTMPTLNKAYLFIYLFIYLFTGPSTLYLISNSYELIIDPVIGKKCNPNPNRKLTEMSRTGNLLLLISSLILRCFSKNISFIVYFYILEIRVITKLPNSEQSYKEKVKTHNYINRQNQSTTGKL